MTENDRKELVERIHNEIEKTQREVEDLKELTKPISPDSAIGRVSRMDAINNRSVNTNRLNMAEIKLKKLRHALQESKAPGFGVCSRCGNPIQIKRLMLLPESNYCIRCAS